MTEKRMRRKKRNTVVTCGLSNNREWTWNQARLLSSLYHVQINTVHSWPSEDISPLKIPLTRRLPLFWGRNCFTSFNLLTSPEGQTTIMTTPPAILFFFSLFFPFEKRTGLQGLAMCQLTSPHTCSQSCSEECRQRGLKQKYLKQLKWKVNKFCITSDTHPIQLLSQPLYPSVSISNNRKQVSFIYLTKGHEENIGCGDFIINVFSSHTRSHQDLVLQ